MSKSPSTGSGQAKVIAIVGPTASGKSALGIFLAKKLGGEIISADSRQVYRGMHVISRASPGHMVGTADPRRPYNAGQYQKAANKILQNIVVRKKVPVVVGGAGLYADALLRGWNLPEVAPDKKLRAKLGKESPFALLAMLQKLDKKSAARVDPYNKVRLIRAIEIAKKLGKVPALNRAPQYKTLWLGVDPGVVAHTRAIKKGVVERLEAGMVWEAKKLRASLPRRRYQELGFEFSLLAGYLDNPDAPKGSGPRPKRREKILLDNLRDALVRGELRYAKRQMRWFKRNKDIRWITGKTEALQLAKRFLSS